MSPKDQSFSFISRDKSNGNLPQLCVGLAVCPQGLQPGRSMSANPVRGQHQVLLHLHQRESRHLLRMSHRLQSPWGRRPFWWLLWGELYDSLFQVNVGRKAKNTEIWEWKRGKMSKQIQHDRTLGGEGRVWRRGRARWRDSREAGSESASCQGTGHQQEAGTGSQASTAHTQESGQPGDVLTLSRG